MKIAPTLFITFSALMAHKTRTFLASLGVMIGISSVIIMVAIGKGSEREIMEVISGMGENLITINAGEMKRRGGRLQLAGNVTTLNIRDAKKLLEEVPQLETVAPYQSKLLQVKFGNSATEATVSGSTPEFPAIRSFEIRDGEFFSSNDLRLARRVAVIGQTTVKNIFGWEDPIGRTLRIKTVPFTVIGVFKPKGMDSDGQDQDDIILVPMTTLMRRILNQGFIDTIYAKARTRREINKAMNGIREKLRELHKLLEGQEDDFTIISQLNIEDMKRETSELFTKLIVGVAAISLVVGGIGILAVMLISVKERTREIGIRRAVGASRSDIVQQFLAESIFICGLGGAIGIFLGVVATLVLATWGPWPLSLNVPSIFISSGVCVFIGLGFGIFPAMKASRLDPMEALRVE